jgi:hemerythrin
MSLIDINKISGNTTQGVHDHFEFGRLSNELHKLLCMDKDNYPIDLKVSKLLMNLIDRFIKHTTNEERLMRKLKYPAYQSHKQHHDELMTELNNAYVDFMKENNHQALIDFLETVLVPWHHRHTSSQDDLLDHFIFNKHYQLTRAKYNTE